MGLGVAVLFPEPLAVKLPCGMGCLFFIALLLPLPPPPPWRGAVGEAVVQAQPVILSPSRQCLL